MRAARWSSAIGIGLLLHVYTSSSLRVDRRCALCLVGTSLRAAPAAAYDALPTASAEAGNSPEAVAKRRATREAKAAEKNGQASLLLKAVSASSTAQQYDEAMAALTVWIIGTGPPIPEGGAAWGSTFEGPLPDGFKTREMISVCKATKDSLPRFRQRAGEPIDGLRDCAPTRGAEDCYSAGPLAETAFKAMLVELKRRAPRQYDTPSGPVAF